MLVQRLFSKRKICLFVGCSLPMFGFTPTAFGTALRVFGLQLETKLSHNERYCSKRFLMKSLLAVGRGDESR